MGVSQNIKNVILVLAVFLFVFVKVSTQEHKEFTIDDPKLCSPITKRKVKHESLVVNQGLSINQHSVSWNIPNLCKFEVQSGYSKGGVVAVIQKLNLRRDPETGGCIDYIQFRAKKGSVSQRHCGFLDARIVMNYFIVGNDDDDDDDDLSMPDSNTFIDVDGELDVVVFIAKEPLGFTERTEFVIVFTSYKNCTERHKPATLLECVDDRKSICINKDYFGDGYINCPYYGCVDEGGCFEPPKSEPKSAVAKRVIIGSISTFGIVFGVFILLIWAFKKHKLFCWAEDFAHPTPTPENNRNSRVLEMNEQTGARLAETLTPDVQPTAPVLEEDKDLPPSYDSLFPTSSSLDKDIRVTEGSDVFPKQPTETATLLSSNTPMLFLSLSTAILDSITYFLKFVNWTSRSLTYTSSKFEDPSRDLRILKFGIEVGFSTPTKRKIQKPRGSYRIKQEIDRKYVHGWGRQEDKWKDTEKDSSTERCKPVTLVECVKNSKTICINKDYFGDGHVSCSYHGSLYEGEYFESLNRQPSSSVSKGIPLTTETLPYFVCILICYLLVWACKRFKLCVENPTPTPGNNHNLNRQPSSSGSKGISLTTATLPLVVCFLILSLLVWAFKRLYLLCAGNSTPKPENNHNSQEMVQTRFVRLAETPTPEEQPIAPVLTQQDLPPSYDIIFPNSRGNSPGGHFV